MKFLADMQDKKSLAKKLRKFSVALQVDVKQMSLDQKIPRSFTSVRLLIHKAVVVLCVSVTIFLGRYCIDNSSFSAVGDRLAVCRQFVCLSCCLSCRCPCIIDALPYQAIPRRAKPTNVGSAGTSTPCEYSTAPHTYIFIFFPS